MRVVIVIVILSICALVILLPLTLISVPPIAIPAADPIRLPQPDQESPQTRPSQPGQAQAASASAGAGDASLASAPEPDLVNEPPPNPAAARPAALTPPTSYLPTFPASSTSSQPLPAPLDDPGLPSAAAPLHPLQRSLEMRRQRIARFGGTVNTENAVEAGLIWLAAHQSPGGLWNRIDYRRMCPPGAPCPGWALYRTDVELDAGVTGLCVLAFLGAGYTDRDGPHQATVSRAVAALVRLQKANGGFCSDETNATYNDSIATLALAEFYGLTGDKRIVPTLERAVRRLVIAQQALGGWDYLPRPDTGRNDTSITAWAVQALQAAAAAGIGVPRETLVKAALHFARATGGDGRVWYADAGTGVRLDDQAKEVSLRYGPAMTAAGMTCMQLLGWTIDNPVALRQRALLLGETPSAARMQHGDHTELHDYYYWYYGTLAAFQIGGETWERWNGALRDATLPLQNRDTIAAGQKKHIYGSWPPYGRGWGQWGRSGGRVYSTAISVLTLEIYYRHSPLFLEDPVLLCAGDWRAYLEHADERTQRLAIKALGAMRLEIGEPVLFDLLGRPVAQPPSAVRPDVALAAAEALAELGSPAGLAVMQQRSGQLGSVDKARVAREISRMQKRAAERVSGTVRVYDAGRRLATLDLPGAWVGLECRVLRGEREIAHATVIQRFSDRSIVVAEIRDDGELLPGDRAESVAP